MNEPTPAKLDPINERHDAPGPKGLLRLIAEHPLVVLIGIIASIVGCLLSWVFGVWPITPKRELTYSVQPVRTAFVEVNHPSDIIVTYKGRPIAGDLTAAQVMIYNAGELPIRRKDLLLNHVTLVVSNAAIIERSFSRGPIEGTDFSLRTNLESGTLPMDWEILEKGDNPIIQILYAGKRNLPITLQGRVEGQLQGIKESPWPYIERKRYTKLKLFFHYQIVVTLIMVISGTIILNWIRSRRIAYAVWIAISFLGSVLYWLFVS
jgi:hypothetical protein